jgi:hypothetical protein
MTRAAMAAANAGQRLVASVPRGHWNTTTFRSRVPSRRDRSRRSLRSASWSVSRPTGDPRRRERSRSSFKCGRSMISVSHISVSPLMADPAGSASATPDDWSAPLASVRRLSRRAKIFERCAPSEPRVAPLPFGVRSPKPEVHAPEAPRDESVDRPRHSSAGRNQELWIFWRVLWKFGAIGE